MDENGQLKSKADMFTKRTIRPERTVTHVDTPAEALAVSIGEKGRVDLPYMAELLGTPENFERITAELCGVIFQDPSDQNWKTADEYLSGNVRNKLQIAKLAAANDPAFEVNVEALTKAQPKELEASEIDVRLGATWISPDIIQKFMNETFQIPFYLRYAIQVKFSRATAEWRVEGKSKTGGSDVMAYETFGTTRASAYKILEDTLNLRDARVYDTVEDENGKPKRVLNKKETMLAGQKQQAIKAGHQGCLCKLGLAGPAAAGGVSTAIQRAFQFHPAPGVRRQPHPLRGDEPGDYSAGTPAQRHRPCALRRKHPAGPRGGRGQDL